MSEVLNPTAPTVPTGHIVLGVGIDVVAVERFSEALQRSPGLAGRLFAPAELVTASGSPRRPVSLAGRFAVKEAVAKALGVPRGMHWHDCAVISEESGRPTLVTVGTVLAAATAMGVTSWRLSLSHDAGIAAALVMALGVSP
jgi:holo-[acyl-carrier protein] synthase